MPAIKNSSIDMIMIPQKLCPTHYNIFRPVNEAIAITEVSEILYSGPKQER